MDAGNIYTNLTPLEIKSALLLTTTVHVGLCISTSFLFLKPMTQPSLKQLFAEKSVSVGKYYAELFTHNY